MRTGVCRDVPSHTGEDGTIKRLAIHSLKNIAEGVDLTLVLAGFPNLDRLCTELIGQGYQARIAGVIAIL